MAEGKSIPERHYRPMLDLPQPKIDKARRTLFPTRARFIAGDPQGLYELAGRMYQYVSMESHPTVGHLVGVITKLVKEDDEPGGYHSGADGGWIGETAYAFRSTFTSDAAMMNGLNSVICSVAKAADDLAVGLSALELKLELEVEKNAPKVDGFNLNWLATKGPGVHPKFGYTALAAPALRRYSDQFTFPKDFISTCNEIAYPIFVQADKLRHAAASQLLAVGKVLEEALGYYANYSASPGSPDTMDPSVLLTSSQYNSDSRAVQDLEGKYSKLSARVNVDQNAAKRALTDLGITAQKSSMLIGGIKDVKDAKGAVATGNKFLALVGNALPLLMEIGLLG
ncbi:hypothetical protein [Actinoallomurus soli]|uniref:hypothetical protein n=1 Tax=Actinoallomurus soli TaxID=2952535 RepID=UPI002092B934|nr:hypothetical protein [Actinoallomurus soli]MCO5967946.1 hypothetical protein [Actinoallomurus soli]